MGTYLPMNIHNGSHVRGASQPPRVIDHWVVALPSFHRMEEETSFPLLIKFVTYIRGPVKRGKFIRPTPDVTRIS